MCYNALQFLDFQILQAVVFNSVLDLTFIEKTLQFSHSLLIVKYNKAVVLYGTPETKLKTFSIELLNFFIKSEIKEVGSWPELHTNYLSKKSWEDRTPIKSSLRYVLCSVLPRINKTEKNYSVFILCRHSLLFKKWAVIYKTWKRRTR